MNWCYGIMTVPERQYTLFSRTLASLKVAGFDSPHFFVDGGTQQNWSVYMQWSKGNCTIRNPKVRTAGNWWLSLWELYYRNPTADRYALFQDDFVTYPNLRYYLEKCPYERKTYWNLYTFPSNEQIASTCRGWYKSNQFGRGALALVFDKETVMTLLHQEHMVTRVQDPQRWYRAIDGGILESLKSKGWTEMVHYPSLTQHTGNQSVMDKRKPSTGRDDTFPVHTWDPVHLSKTFRGEDFDALKLLEPL